MFDRTHNRTGRPRNICLHFWVFNVKLVLQICLETNCISNRDFLLGVVAGAVSFAYAAATRPWTFAEFTPTAPLAIFYFGLLAASQHTVAIHAYLLWSKLVLQNRNEYGYKIFLDYWSRHFTNPGFINAAWSAISPFRVGSNTLNTCVVHAAIVRFAPKHLAVGVLYQQISFTSIFSIGK